MRIRLSVFATLGLVAFMAVLGSGAGAEALKDSNSARIERTEGEVVGASIAHPAAWVVEREPYTYDGSYGYTLWRPDTDKPHDHGGMPAVRVALAYDLAPGRIEAEVRETLAYYDDLPMKRETVRVAEKGYEGVAVGPIPGSTPSTEVYVPVNGRVYRINVYADDPAQPGLGEEGRDLLASLHFSPPSRSVSSLGLPRANAPDALYKGADESLVERERAARASVAMQEGSETTLQTSEATRSGGGGEYAIAEGCWSADPRFYFQTQHGMYANKRWGARWTGWTIIGRPNFWGQYTHGNMNLGRCASNYYTNDKFAVDYPLARNDVVFSPFGRGTVTFAGRNTSHKNYGIFVIIRAANNKYVSMSAHLNGLAGGIRRGKVVTKDTIIGFAGDSGDPSIPVGETHLHQAYYRYPKFLRDGSPYGGRGLQVLYHRYYGTAARKAGYTVSSHIYRFGPVTPNYKATCHESNTCGKGYRIGN